MVSRAIGCVLRLTRCSKNWATACHVAYVMSGLVWRSFRHPVQNEYNNLNHIHCQNAKFLDRRQSNRVFGHTQLRKVGLSKSTIAVGPNERRWRTRSKYSGTSKTVDTHKPHSYKKKNAKQKHHLSTIVGIILKLGMNHATNTFDREHFSLSRKTPGWPLTHLRLCLA